MLGMLGILFKQDLLEGVLHLRQVEPFVKVRRHELAGQFLE